MPRKKLYERKVSEIPHRVKLFEITNSYVKLKAKNEGKSQAEVVRELCEYARLEELTRGQFSVGTTKIFQSVQGSLIKQNVVNPIEQLTESLNKLVEKIDEFQVNSRFMDEEVFKVLKAFMIENQAILNLVLNQDPKAKIGLPQEREKIKSGFEQQFETRKDMFYQKYKKLVDDLKDVSETKL